MKYYSILLWSFILAILAPETHAYQEEARYAHTKAITVEGPTESKAIEPAHKAHVKQDPVLVRPSAGKGVDKVSFGLRAMNFYGSDLKHHTFNVDIVMSIRWRDPRVVRLLPAGLDKLSIARDAASKIIWMPEIVVSNRDIEKYEIVSSSVVIYRNGDVVRVERANTRVMHKFLLEHYPFDVQDLAINIASSKYMLNEVELVPDKTSSGVYDDIWGLYAFKDWHIDSYKTWDGDLEKSRGSLVIKVERTLEKYSQDHLVPAGLYLMISWAVFYFPFANPFIMARLALSILALINFTHLMVQSTSELPGSALFNWNDLLNQQIQAFMFITIILNIASEIAFHTFHHERLARGLNREAKIVVPAMGITNIVVVLGSGKYHWMTLPHAVVTTKVILFVMLLSYAGYALCEQIWEFLHPELATPRDNEDGDVEAMKSPRKTPRR